ncbi:hypothetical protein R3P93_13300 [Rhodococcus cerastii]|uniref:Uncharacterized protein n=1 Tax=Rhodococcus cerastii TaxID=908616 RepID=A0ABU4D2B4_9NOCA|nr:hypothetical protein [Rhodococcus cerastii]MDV6303536.1 hypothetical protein [Rhodococcus cerastii]
MTSNDVTPFGYLRLAGGRFEVAEGLPVVSAAELERYALLVSAVARELYLRDHPKRQRVPRGFDQAFDLRLTRVERGSQIPTLVRPVARDGGLFQNTDWHDEARRLINSALGDISKADRVPAAFPMAAIKPLAQFGRSLRANERIELANSVDDPQRAVLTTETRKRIQRLARLDELEIEAVVVGQVNGLSSVPPHVDVMVAEGAGQRRIGATFSDPSVWGSLHSYLGYGDAAPPVSLSVIAMQNRDGEIVKITDVLHAEPALPPSWSERLRNLAGLGSGWLHPGSEPPSNETVERVERILLATLDAEVGAPAIYPSGDGGIQLEWRTATRAIEVEILNAGSVDSAWYGRAGGDDGEDRSFPMDDPDGIADFVKDAISE